MPKRPNQTKARLRTLNAHLHKERVARLGKQGSLTQKQVTDLLTLPLKKSMEKLMAWARKMKKNETAKETN